MSTYTTTLAVRGYWRGVPLDGEVDVRAEYTATPGRAARTYGPPERCYPAEPAEIEISRIEIAVGPQAWRRASADEAREIAARLIDECWDEMVDQAADDAADARDEYEFERRRELVEG